MNTIEKLRLAATVMENVNKFHGETFMDVKVDPEEEEITFDLKIRDIDLAIDLTRLLAMSYYPEAKGDKIIHTIQP